MLVLGLAVIGMRYRRIVTDSELMRAQPGDMIAALFAVLAQNRTDLLPNFKLLTFMYSGEMR